MNIATIDKTTARMLLYRFLYEAYTYPESKLIEILMSESIWKELQVADGVFGTESRQYMSNMQSYIQQHSADTKKLLQDLQVEYTYLFINAVPRVPASPYESVYTDDGLIMGEPVSQVLHLYREAGLSVKDSFDAPPDHIAAEIEFMFYLIQQEAVSIQNGEENAAVWKRRQEQFLSQHLLKWVPIFLEKMKAGVRQPFYRDLAELLGTLLNIEKKTLEVESGNNL
ncbi:molecular chaperone [Chloroflexota bacterium]